MKREISCLKKDFKTTTISLVNHDSKRFQILLGVRVNGTVNQPRDLVRDYAHKLLGQYDWSMMLRNRVATGKGLLRGVLCGCEFQEEELIEEWGDALRTRKMFFTYLLTSLV